MSFASEAELVENDSLPNLNSMDSQAPIFITAEQQVEAMREYRARQEASWHSPVLPSP
jgi:hypothetical protein